MLKIRRCVKCGRFLSRSDCLSSGLEMTCNRDGGFDPINSYSKQLPSNGLVHDGMIQVFGLQPSNGGPSFARNGASTATLSAFMRTWRLFVILGMLNGRPRVEGMCPEDDVGYVVKCTKIHEIHSDGLDEIIQNGESKTSTVLLQFTVVFPWRKNRGSGELLAGGSASVPGSVMVAASRTHGFPLPSEKQETTHFRGKWFGGTGVFLLYIYFLYSKLNSTGMKNPLQFSCVFSSHRLLFWCFSWGPDSETRGYWWGGGVENRGSQDDDMSMCVLCVLRATNMEAGELSTDDDATMLRAGEIFSVELLVWNVGRGQYWSLFGCL